MVKIFAVSLLSLLALAEAGVPKPEVLVSRFGVQRSLFGSSAYLTSTVGMLFSQIGINVGDAQSGTLGGIEPKIKWGTSGTVAGCDVEVR